MNTPPVIYLGSGTNLPVAHDPRAVANYVLDACDLGGVRDVSHMKLQKLVYLAHREHVGEFGSPLCKLGFEAWEHGPVSPILYQSFKEFGNARIDGRATMIDLETGHDVIVRHKLSDVQQGIMDATLIRYGRMSAAALRAYTHRPGTAWHKVWSMPRASRADMALTDELIALEYKGSLPQRKLDD